METYYIYMVNDTYALTEYEFSIPPNKVAAQTRLTKNRVNELMRMDWDEYQDILEHYYDHGQKLVTA